MSTNNQFRGFRLMAVLLTVALLAFHFYSTCYAAFVDWHGTVPIADRLARNLGHAAILRHRGACKLVLLAFLALTFIGSTNQAPRLHRRNVLKRLVIGLVPYFGADIFLQLTAAPTTIAGLYMVTTLIGGWLLYELLRPLVGWLTAKFSTDIFNTLNESFPQEERLLKAPQSIHFPARYQLRGQTRESMINLVDPYRGLIVMGTPGSGKTRYIFRPLIKQSLARGMALFVYDLKYDDLTRLTWNTFSSLPNEKGGSFGFYSFNFDDLSRSHRCNPLDPASLHDIADAADAARVMMLALNKKWVHMQGDFFVESAVSFFTANIWFLRQYKNGVYCTLPHIIELIQADYHLLFSVLQSYPEIQTRINSFVSAYKNNTMEQLQGQVDSARVPLAALASPKLYWLLSANDFTLDLNDPDKPKVICIGSNPQKQQVYGSIVSLIVTQMLKAVNRQGGVPCQIVADEFPSIHALGMNLALAQARSNKVAIAFGIQDLSQLRQEYGRDAADALFNLPGNIISGQVSGDSARFVSERFGRILQEKTTISTNSRDSSTSESRQLDLAVPASKIATLSSGEFVGITADSPTQPIKLKAFHARFVIDNAALAKEEAAWQPLPEIRTVTPELVQYNFNRIKKEVRELINDRLDTMLRDPELVRLILQANRPSLGKKQAPH
jgi:Type IV secretory system Conjugative DNA transfer/YWFCY protein